MVFSLLSYVHSAGAVLVSLTLKKNLPGFVNSISPNDTVCVPPALIVPVVVLVIGVLIVPSGLPEKGVSVNEYCSCESVPNTFFVILMASPVLSPIVTVGETPFTFIAFLAVSPDFG